jgi:signal transduction histidine kinase
MQARLEQAELTREKEAQRRVEEERLRIAREIHDITAHSLSAVNVQANLALRLIDANPEAAKNSVEAISKTSKQALAEMRGVVGAMRAGASDAPTQGMSAVDTLADYLRAAGLECAINNNGYASDSVPAYIDLALFGITREAVTNVVRHAQATRTTITFGINENTAYVEVVDNGIGATSPEGNGILGMRERASVFGGTFSVTPNYDARGGTTVFAQLSIK